MLGTAERPLYKVHEQIGKLIRLATCPGAFPTEARNARVKALKLIRENNLERSFKMQVKDLEAMETATTVVENDKEKEESMKTVTTADVDVKVEDAPKAEETKKPEEKKPAAGAKKPAAKKPAAEKKPAEKKAAAPKKEAKPKPARQPAPKKEESKADKVRAYVKAAKAKGKDKDHVIDQVVKNLGMAKALARTYVKNNWSKA